MNKSSIFWCLFQKKSVASFFHPQYLLRTSPRSIPCAWNSRIWHFHLNNTLLSRRNVWNLVFATSRPESMKLTCQFRRFLAMTFRPVHIYKQIYIYYHAKIWTFRRMTWQNIFPFEENQYFQEIKMPWKNSCFKTGFDLIPLSKISDDTRNSEIFERGKFSHII